jgi:NAD-dependent SIR2 family protein deacetylase
MKKIVVLTGAGVSKEGGIETFRDIKYKHLFI